ncbi:MAG: Dcp1p-Dcp2p decapping enzyme complex alpha subunit [Bogoriella megaspora]|nr:MAG: Dcp1p-Dcp2p decapping enzyme complex alpha subunit [Bogoriella megaspora]
MGSVPEIPGIQLDPLASEDLRKEVNDLLNRRSRNFPGAQPVSFSKKHLEELCKDDYYLCEKTDGIRCLLYCSGVTGTEEHYLIDRKNNFYHITPLHFPMPDDETFERYHTATLLDGELVYDTIGPNQRELRYLVFDCILLDGKSYISKPLDKRIGAFQAFFLEPYKKCFQHAFPERLEQQAFVIKPKSVQKSYGVMMMFKDILPNLAHGNDGLIFTCKSTPYEFGTDEHILKWKPAHENTVDFRLVLGDFPTEVYEEHGEMPDYDAKPSFELWVLHRSEVWHYFDHLHVSDDEWEMLKGLGQMLDFRIIECHKDEKGRWRMKLEKDGTPRFRDDKLEANHISTVEKVLESINDGVSEEDLLGAAQSIHRAWKQRHPEEQKRVPQQPGPAPNVQKRQRTE